MLGTKQKEASPAAFNNSRQKGSASTSRPERPQQVPPMSERDSKYSLKKLVNAHTREQSHSTRLLEAEAKVEATSAAAEGPSVGRTALESLAEDVSDEEQAARVRHALERQELLTHDVVWDFFGSESCERPVQDFPIPSALDGDVWHRMRDVDFREQSFLSGFAADLISSLSDVPKDLLEWLWEAVVSEPREELAQAYRQTLRTISTDVRRHLSLRHFKDPLAAMGATKEALAPGVVLDHKSQPIKQKMQESPEGLHRYLKAVTVVSAELSEALKGPLLSLLLRLSIDRAINENHELLPDIRASVGTLVDTSGPAHGVLERSLVTSVRHPILHRRILYAVPEETVAQHEIKRQLALSFFLDSVEPTEGLLTHTKEATRCIISNLHQNPIFDYRSEMMDYRTLTAAVNVLDVAIGAGFGTPPLRPTDSSPEQETTYRDAVKYFDKQVDKLSSAINQLYTRIQDTGASHMLRTTAKSTIQNLALRLDFGVRTRPPPRKDVLGKAGKSSRRLDFASLSTGDTKKRKIAFGGMSQASKAEHDKQMRVMERFMSHKKTTDRDEASHSEPEPAPDQATPALEDDDTTSGSFGPAAKALTQVRAAAPLVRPQQSFEQPESAAMRMYLARKKRSGLKSPLSADVTTVSEP